MGRINSKIDVKLLSLIDISNSGQIESFRERSYRDLCKTCQYYFEKRFQDMIKSAQDLYTSPMVGCVYQVTRSKYAHVSNNNEIKLEEDKN